MSEVISSSHISPRDCNDVDTTESLSTFFTPKHSTTHSSTSSSADINQDVIPCSSPINRFSAFSHRSAFSPPSGKAFSQTIMIAGGNTSVTLPSSAYSPFTPVVRSSSVDKPPPPRRRDSLIDSSTPVSHHSNQQHHSNDVTSCKCSSFGQRHISSSPSAFSLSAASVTSGTSNLSAFVLHPVTGDSATPKKSHFCATCGQWHAENAAHVYDYSVPVDLDLLCKLCTQPLVDPLDTECGHTFCTACLKNRLAVNALCPVDGKIVNFLKCQRASNLVNKLLDKLVVMCPNRDYCEEMQLCRNELETHLQRSCRGAMTLCMHSADGCDFFAPRMTHVAHLRECLYHNVHRVDRVTNQLQHSHLDIGDGKNLFRPVKSAIEEGAVQSVNIYRGDGEGLGISVVGGSDTVLNGIVIQEIYLDGMVAKDGRLRPGDQIMAVNGYDLRGATHSQAKRELSKLCVYCTLDVYRELVTVPRLMKSSKDEQMSVTLLKRQDNLLGIKIAGKRSKAGLYIMEIVNGSIADMDGRLQKDDRIVSIDGQDLTMGSQDEAQSIIKSCEEKVNFVVTRRLRASTPDIVRSGCGERPDILNGEPPPSPAPTDRGKGGDKAPAVFHLSSRYNGTGEEPPAVIQVVVRKGPFECLGMSIAGGLLSRRGNTPVYVTNLDPEGVVARTRRVKKGDILLSVNTVELLGLTHENALEILKKAAYNSTSLLLRLIEGPETSSGAGNFMPSWSYWLRLPTICQFSHVVRLKRDPTSGSLGFSITGGTDIRAQVESSITPHPIVVNNIVPESPADHEGGLRCGDVILSVNNISMLKMCHMEAVLILKQCGSPIDIQVVSWPGTLV